jgi:hypothetical protein
MGAKLVIPILRLLGKDVKREDTKLYPYLYLHRFYEPVNIFSADPLI